MYQTLVYKIINEMEMTQIFSGLLLLTLSLPSDDGLV